MVIGATRANLVSLVLRQGMLAAAGACLLPARRAASLDPMKVIRQS